MTADGLGAKGPRRINVAWDYLVWIAVCIFRDQDLSKFQWTGPNRSLGDLQ